MSEEQKKAAAAAVDQKNFEKIEKDIKSKLEANPDLKKIAGQMKFVRDKEGLRIEIIDQADFAMFAIGTTNFLPKAQQLMADVAKSVKDMPNKIAIRGHTDGFSYAQADKMNNWRLSAQRADSTRRFLVAEGLDEKRFMKIEGVADREAFNPDNPLDPRNRRISITVLVQ
jgi:chemotaxis protein MotB